MVIRSITTAIYRVIHRLAGEQVSNCNGINDLES